MERLRLEFTFLPFFFHSQKYHSNFHSVKLFSCYTSYNEMAEAVAERLLDLHCRLISLYILNEADSLSWHSDRPFFEKERCSYIIQMWWLYMQGTTLIFHMLN